MELKNFWITGTNGAPIANPVATVLLPNSETLASGLVDKDGAALANPFTGSDRGHVQFAAPDGRYDLRIVGGGREYTQRVAFSQGAEFAPPPFTIPFTMDPPAAADEERLLIFKFAEKVTFPADFAGSVSFTITAPDADEEYVFQRVASGDDLGDAEDFCTMTVIDDGTISFASDETEFDVGDLLLVPNDAARTAVFTVTLIGER